MKDRIPTVAVVDDKRSNRALVRRSLAGVPASVREYPTGSAFLLEYSRTAERLPDVLVLDFFLEDGHTGLELIAEMAESRPRFLSETRVVGYSSVRPCSMRLAEKSGWIGLWKDKKAKYDPVLRIAVRRLLGSARSKFLSSIR